MVSRLAIPFSWSPSWNPALNRSSVMMNYKHGEQGPFSLAVCMSPPLVLIVLGMKWGLPVAGASAQVPSRLMSPSDPEGGLVDRKCGCAFLMAVVRECSPATLAASQVTDFITVGPNSACPDCQSLVPAFSSITSRSADCGLYHGSNPNRRSSLLPCTVSVTVQ